jgi:hypothetical protein
MRPACHANLFLLEFIIQTIFCEEVELLTTSLCNFLQFELIPPSLIQMFSSESFSQKPSICVLHLIWQTKCHIHARQQVKL